MRELTAEEQAMNRQLRDRFESMKQHFASSTHLEAAYVRSRDVLLAEARRVFSEAQIHPIGPDLDKRSDWWSAIIGVDTDARRDSLMADDVFMQRLKAAAKSGGFEPYLLEIESQETVDRSYKGNWFFRLR